MAYTRDLFQTPGIGVTVNLDHAKRHYYESHRTINPTGIVPKGPILDLWCRTIEPRWPGFHRSVNPCQEFHDDRWRQLEVLP